MELFKNAKKPVVGSKVGQASHSQRSQIAQSPLKNPTPHRPSNDLLTTLRTSPRPEPTTISKHAFLRVAFLLSPLPQELLPQARCLPLRRRRQRREIIAPAQIRTGEEVVLRVVQLWPPGLDLRHPLRRVRATARPVLPRRVPDTQGQCDVITKPPRQPRCRRRSKCLRLSNQHFGLYYLVSSHPSPPGSW